MVEENEGVENRYPYSVSRVYVNGAVAGLSVFMVLVVVKEVFPLLCFMVAASLLTVFRFFVKVRYVFKMARASEVQQGDSRKSLMERSRLVKLLGAVAIVLSLSLLVLATRVSPTYVWLPVMATVASGFGFSEVLFYFYCKRQNV